MSRFHELRVGDAIRFVRMPRCALKPHFPSETSELYTLLISTGDPIQIESMTEDGYPLAGYVDKRDPENPVFHGLVITHEDKGCWERVPH